MENNVWLIMITAFIGVVAGLIICFAGIKKLRMLSTISGFFIGVAMGMAITVSLRIQFTAAAVIIALIGIVVLGILFASAAWFIPLMSRLCVSGLMTTVIIFLYYRMCSSPQIHHGPPPGIAVLVAGFLIGVMLTGYTYIFGKTMYMILNSLNGSGLIALSLWIISAVQEKEISMAVCIVMWLLIAMISTAAQYLVSYLERNGEYSKPETYIISKRFSRKLFKTYIPTGMQKHCSNYCVYCGAPTEKNSLYCGSCGKRMV